MKTITIREAYDWLQVENQRPSSLTNVEWDHLIQYLEQKYQNENVVEYGNKRIRFINLVGVIQLKTVRIEILPKLDLEQNDPALNRRSLLNMLSVTKHLPVSLNDQTRSHYEKVDLSHILAFIYISELFKAVKRGLYRGYRSKTENIKHLKGRLLVSQHIRKNAFMSVNAYCEYDELSANVPLNQLLKAALKVIFPYVRNSTLKTQTWMIYEMFDEVEDVFINTSIIETIQINRQNKHYEAVLQLALAILHSSSMSTGENNQIAYSFLFKMNDLYEWYVGECLKRVLSPGAFKLDLQHKGRKLLIDTHTGRGTVQLKPDFVVSKLVFGEPIPVVILDTKWKNGRYGPNPSDTYQMYAYVTAYKSAERCIILYPKNDNELLLPKWRVPDSSPVKHIEIRTIRLDKVQHTIADLREILSFQ
ncbi:McrC family protein [Metabacillus rhizolycopersici]|uniref:McrC family protein n=1 Tax=Metabacillus rhizolycopersici TaxID=2875709 RepID=A0ABS7UX38_9BACI|nr:McrC family protein [Metabacillus rhizolycopersici]MBZ5752594.1 McrC family protein [Metabacillus rhizolycopersici]